MTDLAAVDSNLSKKQIFYIPLSKLDYFEQAKVLSLAIDVAVDALKKFPPKGFNDYHLDHFINTYLDFKHQVLNPEPKFQNVTSLNYIKNDVLTYFQEGRGDAIQYFWKRVNDKKLGFKRENKLVKILKRQKIKNQVEYDFVIDVLLPYLQEGLLSEKDIVILNQMISDYQDVSK